MAIWTLETDSNFTTFYFPIEEDKVLFHQLVTDYFDASKSILEKWRTLYLLRDSPKKHPDFFSIDGTDIIAISQNAVNKLINFLQDEIELLSLETDAGKYYALNLLKFVNCLDHEKSKYDSIDEGPIVKYSILEFSEEKIGKNMIFKIPELPYQVLITQKFAYQIEMRDLRGLLFDRTINLLWYKE
jgi:hypothetical protein